MGRLFTLKCLEQTLIATVDLAALYLQKKTVYLMAFSRFQHEIERFFAGIRLGFNIDDCRFLVTSLICSLFVTYRETFIGRLTIQQTNILLHRIFDKKSTEEGTNK